MAALKKNLVLTLEYNMGDYSDMEAEGYEIPTDPEDVGLRESFYQSSDASIYDMKIVGARIEEKE